MTGVSCSVHTFDELPCMQDMLCDKTVNTTTPPKGLNSVNCFLRDQDIDVNSLPQKIMGWCMPYDNDSQCKEPTLMPLMILKEVSACTSPPVGK